MKDIFVVTLPNTGRLKQKHIVFDHKKHKIVYQDLFTKSGKLLGHINYVYSE